jgi:hypothetical protein
LRAEATEGTGFAENVDWRPAATGGRQSSCDGGMLSSPMSYDVNVLETRERLLASHE